MRPCRFCGCINALPCYDTENWYVSCSGCLARGPLAPTREAAERAWNGDRILGMIGRPIEKPEERR